MDLLLIRHALPERVELVGAPADPPLSAEGRAQAEAVARHLDRERVDAVYVSPMRRALETAEPLAQRRALAAVVVEDIAEFDRHAEAYVPMEELKASGDPRWQQMVDGGYFDDSDDTEESFVARVVAAIDGIVAENSSRQVAVVCHGGVINAYCGHVLGLDDVMFFEPAYTGISRIQASQRGHRSIVTLNEFSHLPR